MMDSNKLINAVSMESLDSRSLDNASTISSLEPHSQVRTLFVSGLPLDCKPRELYLLFRAYNGYESSLLKITNKNGKISAPVGFVTFASRQDADDACRKLQGVRFDPDNSQTIRLELARSTTKVSKPKQPSPPIISPATLPPMIPQQNLHAALANILPAHGGSVQNALAAASAPAFMTQAQQQAELHNLGDQFHYVNDQSQLFGLSLAQALQCSAASPLILQNQLATAMAAQIQQQQQLNNLINASASMPVIAAPPQNPSVNPPCSTLFVANLGTNVNEDEVREVFKTQPGFSRLRMHHKDSSSSVAFVEYQNVQCATMVLLNLQGYQLSNNNNIRIEFAKAKMGENNNNNPAANPRIKT